MQRLRVVVPLILAALALGLLARARQRHEHERRQLIGGLRSALDAAEVKRPATLDQLLERLEQGGHLRADDVIEVAEVLVEETDLGETGAHYYQDLDAEYQDLDAEAELTRELAGAEEQEKEEWFSKAADLERQVEELRAGLAKKEEELQQVRQNWRLTFSADQANGSGGSESAEEPLLVDVLGAVERARLRFGTRLHFLPEAINSAGESTFLYPAKVYGAIEALDQLAEARTAGPLGKSVKDWLGERGFDYAAHESQTTMGMYGDERTYRYGGAKVTMEEHIRFGTGTDPRHHLRIHLAWHEGESRWLIGHVGRHLTNTRT